SPSPSPLGSPSPSPVGSPSPSPLGSPSPSPADVSPVSSLPGCGGSWKQAPANSTSADTDNRAGEARSTVRIIGAMVQESAPLHQPERPGLAGERVAKTGIGDRDQRRRPLGDRLGVEIRDPVLGDHEAHVPAA